MYGAGRGVPKNDALAAKLYKQGCDGGSATGCYDLGYVYAHGQGVTQSDTMAVVWYRKAAAQGHARSQYCLADMFEYGKGVAKDPAEAIITLTSTEHGYDADQSVGSRFGIAVAIRP